MTLVLVILYLLTLISLFIDQLETIRTSKWALAAVHGGTYVLSLVIAAVWERPFIFPQQAGVFDWFTIGIFIALLGCFFFQSRPVVFTASLFLARAAYLVGFKTLPWRAEFTIPGMILMALVFIFWLTAYLKLDKGLRKRDAAGLRIPAALQTLMSAALLFATLFTFVIWNWHIESAILVSIGGFTFVLGDILWGWKQALTGEEGNRLLAQRFFRAAQILILTGALTHF